MWPAWKLFSMHPAPLDGPPSTDACIPTSVALREMLGRCVPSWNWHVVGGRPTKRTPRGGLWLPDGRGGPHVWVEGRRAGRRITVDITGDQFGGPEVLVEDGLPDAYRANATRALIAHYEHNERETSGLWCAALAQALRLKAEAA
jgi:hypothetical protein